MLLHAFTIEPVQCGRGPVGAPDRAQIVRVEQEPPVASMAEFVQLNETPLDARPLGCCRCSKRRRTLRCRRDLAPRLAEIPLDSRQLL
jgi:hypothetical protein